MDLFPRTDKIMIFTQWVSRSCVLKALIHKGFQRNQSFIRDINTILSTWLECSLLMSAFLGTCQPFISVFEVCGNISTVLGFSGTYQLYNYSFSSGPRCVTRCQNTSSRIIMDLIVSLSIPISDIKIVVTIESKTGSE